MASQAAGLTPARVAAMLDAPAGLYVHVPFCATICPFCPYNKVVPRAGQPQRYFAALLSEARRYRTAGLDALGGFTSLYVGGGTPTLFPDLLASVVAELPVLGERAIEVLPGPDAADRLDLLRDIGFTAVSIGVQSFSDEVLRHLRRPHSAREATATVEAAVERFELVDADLIFDVEYDDARAGTFLRDLTRCFDLGVDQVSTYPLMRFGYTPFGVARHDRRREHSLLADATRLANARGYERRSVWSYHRVGSKTYSSITRRRFVGLGAGASSFLGRDFLVNHFGVETYIDAVARGGLPVARWLRLGRAGGAAYDAFWQAYAGRLQRPGRPHGWDPPVRLARGALRLAEACGLLFPEGPPGYHGLSARGLDRYHDLERLVTYHLIEPLWAEMLTEHVREDSPVRWATTRSARRGPLWPLAKAALERSPRRGPGPGAT